MPPTSDELVTIGWGYGLSETAVAISCLEAAGVRVLAHSGQVVATAWHWTHALGGVELRVPRPQALFARELLADAAPDVAKGGKIARALLAAVLFYFAGIPLPPAGIFIARASTIRVAQGRLTT